MVECINMSQTTFLNCYAGQAASHWVCHSCKKIPANIPLPAVFETGQKEKIPWGKTSLADFEENVNSCYIEIMTWKKNLFLLPSGRAGKEFVQEMKRLVDLFLNKTPT